MYSIYEPQRAKFRESRSVLSSSLISLPRHTRAKHSKSPRYFCKLNRATKFRSWSSQCRAVGRRRARPTRFVQSAPRSCHRRPTAFHGPCTVRQAETFFNFTSPLTRASLTRVTLYLPAIRTLPGRRFLARCTSTSDPARNSRRDVTGKGEIANRRCGGQRLKLLCKLRVAQDGERQIGRRAF